MPESTDKFDVIVVGSGTGGQTAAFLLKEKGLNVALVEKSHLPGGTCALRGCQPKKWFYEAAEAVDKTRHLEGRGIVQASKGEWGRVVQEKNKFTSKVPPGTVKNIQGAGIEFLPGIATFVDDKTLRVNAREIMGDFFILAAGARPMDLPIQGMEHVITNDQFLELNELPDSVVFIGGGFISFEFAHFVARLGGAKQRSMILEVGERPLGPFDAEIVAELVVASTAAGVEVKCGVKIEKIEKTAKGFRVLSKVGDPIETGLVVHGAGRVADLDALSLESAGVKYSRHGIEVDPGMRTSCPHIFAVGDCAATIQLARVADVEALTAAENILADLGQGKGASMDYTAVPAVLFTLPQLATIGKTEEALERDGISFRKNFEKNIGWPTYQRIGLEHAAFKVLVDENNLILGAHILSDQAGGVINTIRSAMIHKIPVDKLYRQTLLSPYPTRESDLSYMLKPLINKDQ
ncbi:MAG: NAD(P)/FAD-dependent oxidoreductase [Desulfobacterium sp.]|nr:NAD(P)/FAD-dependent oxidoreductase [Desulfobacterium sp.]